METGEVVFQDPLGKAIEVRPGAAEDLGDIVLKDGLNIPKLAREKQAEAVSQPQELTQTAEDFFNKIRSAHLRSYAVNRKVRDFPTNEDLSTPEAAYASLTRAEVAEGEVAFSRLSVSELARTMPFAPKKPMAVKEAEKWLEAEVLEVNVYRETNAVVFAKKNFGGKERMDMRWLAPENGRWLNRGNNVVETLDEARTVFSSGCPIEDVKIKLSRPPIANPQEYLQPFVEFLRREADDPRKFLLQALADHRVVILGEIHHRPRYWAFNSSLVRDKAFAERAGVIYMELPGNDQPLAEQFLAAPTYDPQPIIEMLRDMQFSGWPDQAELEFIKTVWEVNHGLSKEQRLRIVPVDMKWSWKDIKTRAGLEVYGDRNQVMADNVLRDLREHSGDPRHALFIVGYMHAMENPTFSRVEPWKPAGWRLCEKLGRTNVFAVFPHSPVSDDQGGINGRIALGLFETAFAALTNRPMAFPLDHGSFGEQVFDAAMDEPTTEPFRHFFQAYLYLGPVEDETLSPLIPNFYTDDFVKEVDRRLQLWQGKGLREMGLKRLDAASLIEFAGEEEGQWGVLRPGWSARSLGPLSAWEFGGDWKQKMVAVKIKNWQQDTVAMRKEALRLFDAIRQADYEHPGYHLSFPSPDVEYQGATDASWMRWICQHFRTNPIVAVDLGERTMNTNGLPAMSYRVSLKNGEKLEGVLPMNYDPGSKKWYGVEGLDWHLKIPSTN
jgi:hypothetical protein